MGAPRPTVLITGAARGLGAALADVFLHNDWTVFTLVRKKEDVDRLAQSGCVPICADVTEAGAESQIRDVLTRSGTALDVLINNAGRPGAGKTLEATDIDNVQQLLDVHCLGALRCTAAAASFLKQASNPRVVNISSRLGSMQWAAEGRFRDIKTSYSYRIAKAAQNMLTLCLDQEFRPEGICVVAVHPGEITTTTSSRDARLSPGDGARLIYDFIVTLQLEHSGRFYRPSFEEIPW